MPLPVLGRRPERPFTCFFTFLIRLRLFFVFSVFVSQQAVCDHVTTSFCTTGVSTYDIIRICVCVCFSH